MIENQGLTGIRFLVPFYSEACLLLATSLISFHFISRFPTPCGKCEGQIKILVGTPTTQTLFEIFKGC
jgi:hypothetical protein